MPEQSPQGKHARRSRPAQSAPAAPPASQEPMPQPRPTPTPPPEVNQRPDQQLAAESSILREQPIVAYALVFALLALLLLCAFSIYMATH